MFSEKFRKLPGTYRWLDPQGIHLTLHFLGDVDPEMISKIMQGCQKAVRIIAPMRLKFSGCGVFPNFRQPRVFWAGVKGGAKELTALHASLAEQLTVLGLELDKRPFSPHLTLARIKFLKKPGPLKQMVEQNSSEYVGDLEVSKITVYKSELTPSGPEYTILGETYLKGE